MSAYYSQVAHFDISHFSHLFCNVKNLPFSQEVQKLLAWQVKQLKSQFVHYKLILLKVKPSSHTQFGALEILIYVIHSIQLSLVI